MQGLHKNVEREALEFVKSYEGLKQKEEKYNRLMGTLKERHSLCDRKINDIMHNDVEFQDELSQEEMVEVYMELSDVTKLRRKTKDRIDFYRLVLHFYQRGGTMEDFEELESKIIATIQAKKKRKYKNRVKTVEAI